MIIGSKLKFLVMMVPFMLSGCSTYSSSFGCGDAPGAKCLPMDKVDRLIASGEIENFTKIACRGANCRKQGPGLPAVQEDLHDLRIEFERKEVGLERKEEKRND